VSSGLLAAARTADVRMRDRIAVALDELLGDANLMRAIGARLLSRPVSRGAGSTVIAIARELHTHPVTLSRRVFRAGGASIRFFRREMIIVRVAAIVAPSGVPWPVAAEILGTPRTQQLLGLIRMHTGLAPGLWRDRSDPEKQFIRFRKFLTANARPWSVLDEYPAVSVSSSSCPK
jgi:hypothetical protein